LSPKPGITNPPKQTRRRKPTVAISQLTVSRPPGQEIAQNSQVPEGALTTGMVDEIAPTAEHQRSKITPVNHTTDVI
jgi:hypothetical protein